MFIKQTNYFPPKFQHPFRLLRCNCHNLHLNSSQLIHTRFGYKDNFLIEAYFVKTSSFFESLMDVWLLRDLHLVTSRDKVSHDIVN